MNDKQTTEQVAAALEQALSLNERAQVLPQTHLAYIKKAVLLLRRSLLKQQLGVKVVA